MKILLTALEVRHLFTPGGNTPFDVATRNKNGLRSHPSN